jgi:hypothetical protein
MKGGASDISVSSTNKTDRHDITNIIESGVKHHSPNPNPNP